MAATPYLLQLPDPDTAPARSNVDGSDTFVVMAESSADAKAFVQNYAPKKVWANVTPVQTTEAADMSGWSLRILLQNTDGSIKTDQTVVNAGLVERLVLATGVLTSSENYAATDTVVIGGKTYTFVSPIGVTEGNVLLGVDEATSIANLAAAINHSSGAGTTYVAAAANPNVTAVAAAHTLTVTAVPSLTAAQANAVTTTAGMHSPGNGAWGGATLSGGLDTSNKMSSLAVLMVAALNSSGVIAGASFNNSTHTLTVAAVSDNLGDHIFSAFVTPPNTDPISPTGVQTRTGVSVPGFVGTITDGGAAGSALTVVFATDSYGIPSLVTKGRTQE